MMRNESRLSNGPVDVFLKAASNGFRLGMTTVVTWMFGLMASMYCELSTALIFHQD